MRSKEITSSRSSWLWATACAGLLLLIVLVRDQFSADPYKKFYEKAQSFEARGQTDQALKHYHLISSLHPESVYAPEALAREAAILAGQGREKNDHELLRRAVIAYRQLGKGDRPELAGQALLSAAEILAGDLEDRATAALLCQEVLAQFGGNEAVAAKATLKLGRIALDDGRREAARDGLQKVLQNFPTQKSACAEAQFHLGILFETQFSRKDWAESAYRGTIEHYPQSEWAASARQRIGLLMYHQGANRHPARLVLLETQPIPSDSANAEFAPGTLIGAVRLILGARGLPTDAVILEGWTLRPFWAAFNPKNPGEVANSPLEALDNILSNAGLRYEKRGGADAAQALLALQNTLDTGRPAVVFNGQWQLAVGYDSDQQEVFLQSSGARVQAQTVKQFQNSWKRKAPDGGPFALLAFAANGEKSRQSRVEGAAAEAAMRQIGRDSETTEPIGPAATTLATPVPPPLLGVRPAYVLALKPLSPGDAHRRTLRRAAALLGRPREDGLLLNAEALGALAAELERCAAINEPSPSESPVPFAEGEPDGEATPTALPADSKADQQRKTRATELLAWFGAPLQDWIAKRRDAAAYLEAAATVLGKPQLRSAAEKLRASIAALQKAEDALPSAEKLKVEGLAATSKALTESARLLREARDAERNAARMLNGF